MMIGFQPVLPRKDVDLEDIAEKAREPPIKAGEEVKFEVQIKELLKDEKVWNNFALKDIYLKFRWLHYDTFYYLIKN